MDGSENSAKSVGGGKTRTQNEPVRVKKFAQKLTRIAAPSSTTGRVNLNRRVTAEEIMDTALSVFAQKGYIGTNLSDVADQLGVTRQALYYHFRAKHDILVAIFECIFDDLDNAMREAVVPKMDPATRFRKMVIAHFTVVASAPNRAAVLIQEHRHLPLDAARRALERRDTLLSSFAKTYSEGVKAGAFKDQDPIIVAHLIIGAGTSLHRWFRPEGKLDVSQIAEIAEKLLSSGYRR